MQGLSGKDIGQYRILEEIGRGRISTVYRAYQPSLGHYAAIKAVPSFTGEDPQFASRFKEIAKSVARLEHPNIVKIYGLREEGDSIYIIMSYIQGQTLAQRESQPIGFDQAANVVRQVANALDYAHKRGVIHGDVKPSNILLTPEGQAVLSDFGLAEAVASSPGLASMGLSLRSPEYLSPEGCLGQAVDARSDLYSLGVVLYRMFTGVVPFSGDSPTAIMHGHIYEKPEPPRKLNRMIPRAAEKVLLKALAKNSEDRYPSAGELSRALDEALSLGRVPSKQPAWVVRWTKVLDELNTRLILLRHRLARAGISSVVLVAIGIGLIVLMMLGFYGWQRYQQSQIELHNARLEALYSQGMHDLELGQCEAAMTQFDQILQIDPSYKDARAQRDAAQTRCEMQELCQRGASDFEQGNWAQAIESFEEVQGEGQKCPELAKEVHEAYANYGRQLVIEGNIEQASAQFEKALALRPDDLEIAEEQRYALSYASGRAAYEAGEWTDAVASLGPLYEERPDYQADLPTMLYEAYIKIGDVYHTQKEWCDAWEAYDQAASLALADTSEARQKRTEAELSCWPPTPIPTITPTPTVTPTPTPRPRPTATPVPLCFIGEVVRSDYINPGLIQIEGRVLDRNGQGIPDVLVRASAWGTELLTRTWVDGSYKIHGIVNAIPWEVDLPEVPCVATTANLELGRKAVVDFVEQKCP
jgi:serine/threonine-protein kinase